MSDDIAKIAAGLTKAQHNAYWDLDANDGRWQLLPHDGWRRSGQACSSLCRIGLAERMRVRGETVYRLTPLGLAVRNYLQQKGSGHD